MHEVLTELFGDEYVLHKKRVPSGLPPLKEEHPLRFDCIVLPDLDSNRSRYMFFEYDGEHHFKKNPAICRRDRLKNFWAVQHNMHLLRLGFSNRMNARTVIEQFLDRVERTKARARVIQFQGREYNNQYARSMIPIIELGQALPLPKLHLLICSYI